MLTGNSQTDEISDKNEQSDRNCSAGHSCSIEASRPFQRFLWETELEIDRLIYLLEKAAKQLQQCGCYYLRLVGLTEWRAKTIQGVMV